MNHASAHTSAIVANTNHQSNCLTLPSQLYLNPIFDNNRTKNKTVFCWRQARARISHCPVSQNLVSQVYWFIETTLASSTCSSTVSPHQIPNPGWGAGTAMPISRTSCTRLRRNSRFCFVSTHFQQISCDLCRVVQVQCMI